MNHEANPSDLNESSSKTLTGLESVTKTHNNSICDDSPINDAEQLESEELTFQNYSRARLRRLAKELGVRGFSKMEIPDLIAAIASHPEAQRVCTS